MEKLLNFTALFMESLSSSSSLIWQKTDSNLTELFTQKHHNETSAIADLPNFEHWLLKNILRFVRKVLHTCGYSSSYPARRTWFRQILQLRGGPNLLTWSNHEEWWGSRSSSSLWYFCMAYWMIIENSCRASRRISNTSRISNSGLKKYILRLVRKV